MPLKRRNPALLDRKEIDLAKQKALRDELRVLAEGRDTEFWTSIRKKVQNKQALTEIELDTYLGKPEREVWALLEQRRIYRFFVSMTDDSERALAVIEKRISALQEEIDAQRKRADLH